MRLIEIAFDFPSGMSISDTATIDDTSTVYVSERLLQVLRVMDLTEAPPAVTVMLDGQCVEVSQRGESFEVCCDITAQLSEPPPAIGARLLAPFLEPTKDQRQQFGRFLHTISAASLVGAVGFWHSTSVWTTSAVLNELGLAVAFVVTLYRGMVSMKGE
jgi:hypothetical protein